jgi:hypothetical protein
MRTMAEALDRMKAGMVAAYRDKSGRDDAEIEALMRDETWLSAAARGDPHQLHATGGRDVRFSEDPAAQA